MKNAPKAVFINPPNQLKDRVFSINGKGPDIAAANRAINVLAGEFLRRLPEDFKRIDQAVRDLNEAPQNPACRATLFKLVHGLKGIAGTFDYMLISVIGNDLCRFIEHAKKIEPYHIKVVEYHISAMKKVVKRKMTGLDHTDGRAMVDALHTMVQKALMVEHTEDPVDKC